MNGFSAEFSELTNTEFVDQFPALSRAGITPLPKSRKRSSKHLPSSPLKKLKFIHHGIDELIERKRIGEYIIFKHTQYEIISLFNIFA